MPATLQLTDEEKRLLAGPVPKDFDPERVKDGKPGNDHERLVLKIWDHSIKKALDEVFFNTAKANGGFLAALATGGTYEPHGKRFVGDNLPEAIMPRKATDRR